MSFRLANICLLGSVLLAAWLRAASGGTLPPGFTETGVGGTWNEAVGLTFAKDGRMFVWERGGRVWLIENGAKLPTPLVDIHDEVGAWRDHGLLGFAPDPNFPTNGYVYLFYAVDHHHLTKFGTTNYSPAADEYFQATVGRITRYTARAADGFHTVDPASRLVLLGGSATNGIPLTHESHGVGSLVFGRDGSLLASCGDGGSFITVDKGSAPESYYVQALAEGILRPKENVGAFRVQMVDSLNGKILRLDPATGNGVTNNPFFDAAAPRAARSRVWALGLRNPCRMTLRPGTGSTNPADANPGVLYFGDVGMNSWEELDVCTAPGQNFGWPIYEGLEAHPTFSVATNQNPDAPNPLYPGVFCSRPNFTFRELIVQETPGPPAWPNPCGYLETIPATLPRFMHRRPALDWARLTGPARTGIFSGAIADVAIVGYPGSPVSGTSFAGNCSIGGAWYAGTQFPAGYSNTYFHADYGGHWIKQFTFDTNNHPLSVTNFLDDGGDIVFVAAGPLDGALYYIRWTTELKKITWIAASNQPPVAVAACATNFGPSPLPVQFNSAGSFDPDGGPVTFLWDFGDGSTTNTASPLHTFTAPAGVPTPRTVTLVVTDDHGAAATNTLLVSINNTPPAVTITSPRDGTLYSASNAVLYLLRADISDAEHSAAQLTYAWQVILHHNEHEHLSPPDFNRDTSGLVTPTGCGTETFYYRIVLTVTDAAGLATTREVRLYPDCPGAIGPPGPKDTDSDGLPDEWEIAHGLNPFDARDAASDPDGDGLTNLEEFLGGSDPNDKSSAFRIETLTVPGERRVHFQSLTNRVYTLHWRDDAGTNAWTEIPGQVRVPGAGGPQFLRDTNPPPINRIYRISVELP